jgi:hypothetical protein
LLIPPLDAPLPDIDSRVNQVFNIKYKGKSFWDRGDFPAVVQNASEQITLQNPWLKSDNNSAPFDRRTSLP